MNKLARFSIALIVLAFAAFLSYKTPHSSTNASSDESTQLKVVASEVTSTRSDQMERTDSNSPIDFKHIIGADFKRHTGEPTGGHTLINGDVRVIEGTESVPDAAGVYRAQVQMVDPKHPGQWLTKIDRNGNPMSNTMFPKNWNAAQVVNEVNAAWFSPTKTVRGDKWSAITPSGVRVEGYLEPRVTAYPVYSKRH